MSTNNQKKLLLAVFLINFLFFIVESLAGIISHSLGLVADAFDMLGDAFVYGLSYYSVGRSNELKRRIARMSGYLQLCLAVLGFAEVLRRFFGLEEIPGFQTMILISLLALAGNIASMYLLQKSKSDEVHIQASKVFTNNDILANVGVIVAGAMVYLSHSKYPDLIIGALVFALVARGALRILRMTRNRV